MKIFNRSRIAVLAIAVLAIAALAFIPSWDTAEASNTNICWGSLECENEFLACQNSCQGAPLSCFRQCIRDYKDCSIAAGAP